MTKLSRIVCTVVTALAVVLVVTTDQGATADQRVAVSHRSSPAPDAYFRAVYFLQGPLASAMPRLMRTQYGAALAGVSAADVDPVVHRIQARHPGFMSRFADELTSGNPYRVAATITDGARLLQRDARPGLRTASGQKPDVVWAEADVLVTGEVAAHAFALAEVAVAAVAVAVAAAFALARPDSQLDRQQVVAAITKSMAGRR